MPSTTKADLLRQLPSVDLLLSQAYDLMADYGRESLLDAIRAELESTRQQILAEQDVHVDQAALLDRISARLEAVFEPTLRPVINATGVIVHTNLGRAPLADEAMGAMQQVAAGYNTLEFEMETGKRGSRLDHAAALLTRLTGAEAALVVNNNAAATVLMLAGLATGRDVIVSRGQLVEIGGGFRVPDIMAQSGANLVEVGTTNRTRAGDYEQAITDNTALLMRVHSSNFRLVGFTEEAPLDELAAIAGRHGLHLVDDLGSGALIDTAVYGLDHEPTPQESLAAGCDLVCFSGDKLLGGPQAGILVGRRALIDQLKRHPLARAIRADKLCLAALSATLTHYLRGDAVEQIPVLRMIARPLDDIRAAAEEWAARLGPKARAIAGESTVGGGSLPGATLPTMLVSLQPEQPDVFAAELRHAKTPVIARIAQDQVLLDPRTVLPGQEPALLESVSAALRGEVKL
jgi:L-seryl-tRNA(Ser) seleniumtransferase